jgi:hypothetical protein
VHLQVERRQHEQREQGGRDQPADHHGRQRPLDLGPLKIQHQERQPLGRSANVGVKSARRMAAIRITVLGLTLSICLGLSLVACTGSEPLPPLPRRPPWTAKLQAFSISNLPDYSHAEIEKAVRVEFCDLVRYPERFEGRLRRRLPREAARRLSTSSGVITIGGMGGSQTRRNSSGVLASHHGRASSAPRIATSVVT